MELKSIIVMIFDVVKNKNTFLSFMFAFWPPEISHCYLYICNFMVNYPFSNFGLFLLLK